MILIRGVWWRFWMVMAMMRLILIVAVVVRIRRFPVSLLELFTHAIEGVPSFEPYTLIINS
jgi:hypothetical protein